MLAITLVGHSVALEAGTPDLSPFALLLPLSVALGTAFVDRRLSAATLIGFVAGAQLLMHIVLTVGFAHGAHEGATLIPGPRMLVAHSLATGAVVALLLYGEDVLHRWLRFLVDLARTWDFTVAVPVSGLRVAATTGPTPALTSQFRSSVCRRGPPSARTDR